MNLSRTIAGLMGGGVAALLVGCSGGELLQRFTFEPDAIKPQQTTLTLRKGERLQFWNSLDLSYQSGLTLAFNISLKPKGVGEESRLICDALNPSMTFMSTKVQVQDSISQAWKQARMRCGFGPLTQDQTLTITAVPQASGPVQIKRLILEVKR